MSDIETVGDLIAKLQKVDPEIKVGLFHSDYGLSPVECLDIQVTGKYDFISGPPGTEVLVIS